MKQVVFRSTTVAHIYSPGGEKIGFIGVMELKSVMEMDRHSRNSGKGHEETADSDLLLPIITRYQRFTLTDDQPTKTSLD